MIIRSIIAVLIACNCVDGAIAHEFKDGFVERTMAVVVRDQTAIVEYSVGMNAKTMRQVVELWARDNDAISQQNNVDSGQTTQNVTNKTTTALPQTAPTDKTAAPVVSAPKKLASIQDNPIRPSVNSEDAATASEFAHQIPPELLDEFKSKAIKSIIKKIDFLCDGQPLSPAKSELGLPPKHPFTIVVRYEFKMPVGERIDLAIHDSNFHNLNGAVRYALKTKGQSMLMQSNQAAILVRSKRVELNDVSPDKLKAETTITGRLAIFN